MSARVEAASEDPDTSDIEWPPCPPRTEGAKPHCPDCSGIVGETGIVW